MSIRAIATAGLALLSACERESQPAPDTARTTPTVADSARESPELTAAATKIVGFLRGNVPFSEIRLADTVDLYLGPEEGRSRRTVPREALRQPSNWSVRSQPTRYTYSFVPHPRLTVLTTRVGRHLRCMDYPLAESFPELAALPHVGTTLKPEDYQSCLQTWNLTLVFDSAAVSPTLVAAIYDQFEW
jgi:hypothetical protein